MKLLIFIPYYKPHIGGVEFYAQEMNEYLTKHNYHITIFTSRIPNTIKTNRFSSNIKIIRFPAFEIISNYPLPKFWTVAFWKLFINLFHQKFDIIISHTRFFNTSFLALVYSKIKRTPWIHIEHGSDFVKSSGYIVRLIAKIYDYTFGKLILRTSSINVAISTNVAIFIKKFDKRPSPAIRRGLDISKLDTIGPNNYWRNNYPNKIIIGFVGRLIDGKGVLDLISVLSKISTQPFICLIIGDGPQKTILKNAINKHKLQNKIFLLGKKDHPETIALMKSFDIFINPSYTEGLPTTVLEASACQNAIIATDVGGTKEIIKHRHSGYLIKPRDKQSLQKYLLALINNPARMKKLGKMARQSTKENFSWQKSIEKYEKIFKEVLEKK